MPVHDAMYTHAQISKLQDKLDPSDPLHADLEVLKSRAAKASSESAAVVLDFFKALKIAMKSDDEELALFAASMYSGPYNTEIA